MSLFGFFSNKKSIQNSKPEKRKEPVYAFSEELDRRITHDILHDPLKLQEALKGSSILSTTRLRNGHTLMTWAIASQKRHKDVLHDMYAQFQKSEPEFYDRMMYFADKDDMFILCSSQEFMQRLGIKHGKPAVVLDENYAGSWRKLEAATQNPWERYNQSLQLTLAIDDLPVDHDVLSLFQAAEVENDPIIMLLHEKLRDAFLHVEKSLKKGEPVTYHPLRFQFNSNAYFKEPPKSPAREIISRFIKAAQNPEMQRTIPWLASYKPDEKTLLNAFDPDWEKRMKEYYDAQLNKPSSSGSSGDVGDMEPGLERSRSYPKEAEKDTFEDEHKRREEEKKKKEEEYQNFLRTQRTLELHDMGFYDWQPMRAMHLNVQSMLAQQKQMIKENFIKDLNRNTRSDRDLDMGR